MAAPATLNVAQLIDERPIGAFHVAVVIFAFLIVISDGYDISAIAFAAPHLLKEWGITNRAALGPVFSASLVGILIGSPLFGYIGDRYGRKTAAIASLVTFGIFTLAAAWSTSLDQMLWLRALTGLGLGGLMPTMIALTGEFAPRRYRATLIILMFCGVTLGGAIPGAISVWLVPTYGWQALFILGGILPLVLAIAAAIWLPESLKYLVVKGERARAVGVLRQVAPNTEIGSQTQFVIPDEKKYASFSPKLLFADGMGLITPLLWLCFAINLMGFYFLISWIPTLLTGQKIFTPADAAIAASLVQIGGTIGGLVLCRPMDSKGFWPVALLFVLAIPCVGLIGYAAVSSTTFLMAMVFLAGFCILGLQFGLNAASAMIYPTAIRSNGSGWAFGVGRFGSILGPILGGMLISMQLSLPSLFVVAALPFVIGAIACVILARAYTERFKGTALGERDAAIVH